MKTYTCANCGKIFEDYTSNRVKSKTGMHCCSMKCKGEYQTRQAVDRAPIKTESYCIRCNQTKPISEFYKDKRCRANGGVQYSCKSCTKETRKKHYDENIDAINARVQDYQNRNPGRHGKNSVAEDEAKAQSILNRAVRTGKLVRPSKCQDCGKTAKRILGHHWNGYNNPLDVIWLCPSCHHKAHGRGPKARRLSEKKGSPRIDWETVLCMEKPQI